LLKAVLFDMDGVIIDSEPQHARAAVLALQKYNVDISIDYAYQFIGTTTYHMCCKMVEDFSLSVTPEELLKANEESKNYLSQTEGYEAIPYIVDLMKDLHRHGIKMIIASSSSGQSIEEVIRYLHIGELLDGYISGTSVAHPKPAPDIFLEAARILGVEPSECIVIEDSYNGVTAADVAGITSIGFLNPNSGTQDLRKSAILIEGFDEVDYHFINMVYQHAKLLPATILTTERLILRELAVEDIKTLCQICDKPTIRKLLTDYTGDPALEKAKLEAYIKNIYHYYGYGLWGIFMKETGQLIGRCGIEYKILNGEAVHELGYLIDTDYQGLGYATEAVRATLDYAFERLDIDRILAVIEKGNIPSAHLADKLGMELIAEMIHDQRDCNVFEIRKRDLLR
jgi:HAD superfamily hydrolase (TIGR01509 family)